MQIDTALRNYTVAKESGCWEWNSSFTRQGYGQARIGQTMKAMHRFFFEHHKGPVNSGALICHRCNNRKCVNPAHLYAGTHKQNSADAIAAGTTTKGERMGTSKLKESEAISIRESNMPALDIAAKYSISVWTVFDIRSGRRWSYLSAAGFHRRPDKPRIRVTVPAPLSKEPQK